MPPTGLRTMHRPFLAVLALALLAALPAPATATPLQIEFAAQLRDIRSDNSVGFRAGDSHLLDAIVNTTDGGIPPDDTIVTATNLATGITRGLSRQFDLSNEFVRRRDFGTQPISPWRITASSGGDSVSAVTGDLTGAPAIPLVRNVRIVGGGLTPTLLWDLPASVPGGIDRVRVGYFDDFTNERLLFDGDKLFEDLAPDATSFTFPAGLLEEDVAYVFRIILEQVEDPGQPQVRNRATTFVNFATGIVGGVGEVFLPTIGASGTFNFDIDVLGDRQISIDPFVATGYEYQIGAGDPNFASVLLPFVGDGSYLVSFFDGSTLIEEMLTANAEFFFPAGGVDRFTVTGIETSALLDPGDPTAFATTLRFVANGSFTGTMTPLTTFVAVPAPATAWLLAPLGLAAWRRLGAGRS